jgi:hypothetical protein
MILPWLFPKVGLTPHCTDICGWSREPWRTAGQWRRPHRDPSVDRLSQIAAQLPDRQRHGGKRRLFGNADVTEIVIQHEATSPMRIVEL